MAMISDSRNQPQTGDSISSFFSVEHEEISTTNINMQENQHSSNEEDLFLHQLDDTLVELEPRFTGFRKGNLSKIDGSDGKKRKMASDDASQLIPPKNVNDVREENEVAEKKHDEEEGVVIKAKRGQAMSRHSLAERIRRERISERMKFLQGLVPGCNKISGKAVMLDEIINYVLSLQHQVEFLSMKLALVDPRTGRECPTSMLKFYN